jgi:hypothetical protein
VHGDLCGPVTPATPGGQRYQVVRVRPLELLTSGPPDSPVVHRTGPVHCPVRLLTHVLTLHAQSALFLFTVAVADDRWRLEPLLRLVHRTVWCYTGQSLFTVRCAFWRCSDFCAHCSALTALCRRPLARSSRCSTGAPDSPVLHRTVR